MSYQVQLNGYKTPSRFADSPFAGGEAFCCQTSLMKSSMNSPLLRGDVTE